ncbi:hypothetical protein [Novosphingobium aquae]|uniref:Lipoprotein n=1 Tax=Novosphingobium aquae TaxID=3133435 RepID=A0ABU8S5I3_9SPHN
MIARVILPVLCLGLSACASLPDDRLDDWAKFGERARIGDVLVRPDRLVEDSRCPMNARCVWAGRVVIDATVWANGARRSVQLESNKPLALRSGELSIAEIRPDSFMTNASPRRADYNFRSSYKRR